MRPSGFRPQEGAHHDAALYEAYRPDYPPRCLEPFVRALEGAGGSTSLRPPERPLEDLRILDFGCGSGQGLKAYSRAREALGRSSARSLRWIGIDPNAEMLAQNAALAAELGIPFVGVHAAAESTDVWRAHAPCDGALFASSLHWMDPAQVAPTLRRALGPRAPILFLEYQFPQIDEAPALNEWIKECFRTRWRFAEQRPRGKFRDLVRPWVAALTEKPAPVHLPLQTDDWTADVTRESFQGLLLSQARVTAALARGPGEQAWIEAELEARFPTNLRLRFRSEAILTQAP